MALDGFQIAPAAPAAPAASAAPVQPAGASTAALKGFSIGAPAKAAAPVQAAPAAPSAMKGVNVNQPADGADVDSLVSSTPAANTSGLFMQSKAAGVGPITPSKADVTTLPKDYTSLKKMYDTKASKLTSDVAQFTKDKDAYEKEIDSWNAKGGAPSDEIARLNASRQALMARADSLRASNDYVNSLVDPLNTAATTASVDDYAARGGTVIAAQGYSTPPLPSLTGSYISAAKENYKPWYEKAFGAWNDTIKSSVDSLVDSAVDLTYSLMGLTGKTAADGTMEKSGLAPADQTGDRVAKTLAVAGNLAGALSLPITAPLAAASETPGLRTASKTLNTVFADIGEIVKPTAELVVSKLPVSQTTKDALQKPVEDLFALLAQVGTGAVIHAEVMPKIEALQDKISSKAGDAFQAVTKNETSTTIPAKTVHITADKVYDFISGRMSSSEEIDLYKTLGRTADEMKSDRKNGITINIPERTQTVLEDKPYWGKIKDLFGLDRTSETSGTLKGSPVVTVRGYLPEGAKGEILAKEIKEAIVSHGEDVVHQELQDKLGYSQNEATKLISEVQAPKTASELDAAHEEILGKVAPEALPPKPLEGIDLKQQTKLSDEAAAPLAAAAADRYYREKIQPAIESDKAIVISADDLKDHFGLDYNDHNHPVYSKAAFQIYERALKENTDKTVVLTGGGPASGKTELIVKGLINRGFKGIIYDSNMAKYEGVAKQIDMAKAAGKNVEVYGVLPDLNRARTFSIIRGNEIGRHISDATFARGHANFPATLRRLIEEGKISPTDVHLSDTRNDKTFKDSFDRVAGGTREKDPLAVLRKLDYNETNLKTDYGKANFDATTGERTKQLPRSGSAGEASLQDRADQGNAKRGRDEGVLGRDKEEKVAEDKKFSEGLQQLAVSMELAEAGKRIFVTGSDGRPEVKGLSSTFPKWVPEELRSKDLFDKVLGMLGDGQSLDSIKIPPEKNVKQRALLREILTELHATTGVDVSEITDQLNDKTSKADDRSARGSEEFDAGKEADRIFGGVNMQGGFVDPAAMADAVKDIVKSADAQIKNFIETTMEPVKITEDLTDSFARLEGAAQADLETMNKLVKSLDINKADDEALYAHAEDPSSPLTEKQEELLKKFDEPLKKMNKALFERIKGDGMKLDEDDNYISRFPKEKPSVLQRIFDPAEGRTSSSGQGGILSKSAPSLKKRTMKILIDEEGNRTVASIKDGEVTAFKNKEAQPLGPIQAKITPKQREWYDNNVMPKLEKLAKDLGITLSRLTTKLPGVGPRVAGVSYTGQNRIATRAATPERVLLHEIGHQLDERYGMQEIFKKDDARNYGKDTMQNELRAVADLRITDVDNVKKSFKSYIRKSEEKIAAMFEAYLHIPDQFEEVAPNLFEKFEEFLSAHAETRPILDLKPSIALGMRDVGGNLVRGKSGSTFIDKNGKKYTIREATTAEIEEHTDLEYHHSALASRLTQYMKLRQIDRANQFLESWKASADFNKIAVPSDGLPPAGWRMTKQQNFRNYFFEPRTAEVLDDMQERLDGGMYNDAFQGINRILANSIFFNGLAHPLNVLTAWAFNRGASSMLMPEAYRSGFKAGMRALDALRTKNADYMELLRNGAHLMSSDVTGKKLAENLVKKLGADAEKNPDVFEKIMGAIGYAGKQLSFKNNVLYKLSHDMAWLSNDFLTMQSIFETMDRRGISMKEAINEVSRFIPDYRQQTRLLDKPLTALGTLIGKPEAGGATARFLAKKIVYNRNVSMFGSYHVGLMQSLWNAVKDTATGEDMAERGRGLDKLLMLAVLAAVIYPWLDKLATQVTGNPDTYVTRSGIVKYPYMLYKWFTGRTTTSQTLQSVVTPAIGTQSMIELFFNRDLFTGNNIYGVGGEGIGGFMANKIAPVAEVKKISSGLSSPGDFGLSLLGVRTPKNDQLALDLNAMIYNEKPQVSSKMKALVAGGDLQGAKTIGHEFNVRLAAQIRSADISEGNSGSQARVDFFLNQYGVKMPGEKAMENYNAKQGKNIVQKTLPSGKPVVTTGTPLPSTGVINTITTYARAIGTDPITAFKDIFAGESIKAVTNGTIIVNRMSLAASEADRKKDAAAQGLPTPKGMNLDHIVPLEGGGDNSDNNLQLIPEAQWKINTPVENFLAGELSAGSLTKDQVREIAIRFKAGQGELLSDSIKKEYYNKYGGKPLSIQDLVDQYGYPAR